MPDLFVCRFPIPPPVFPILRDLPPVRSHFIQRGLCFSIRPSVSPSVSTSPILSLWLVTFSR